MNHLTYTVETTKTPCFIACGGLEHYVYEGGWFPHEGSEVFAKKIVPMIYKSGGKVLVKAKV